MAFATKHDLSSIETQEFMIPTERQDVALFVRNKRVAGLKAFASERTVLFVHGSTYPASTSFDLALDGVSWMDCLAAQGYDTYLVDLRGYGRSSRPAEMSAPAEDGLPVVRTETAAGDVERVVNFIRQRRGIEQLNLIGWSWGTTIMASFTAGHNDLVNKLVLLAPQWLRTTPSMSDTGGPLGSYRIVSRADAKARWLNGVPADKQDAILPANWFETWADATFATDDWGRTQNPQLLRAPNGTVQDSREYWAAGRPLYSPSEIHVPTLIVHAERDRDLPLDMSRAYFSLLTSARYKRWVEIGDGTHSLFMETCRWQVFEAVQSFLDNDPPIDSANELKSRREM
ncbi:alpha/beta hydrolase [Rhizobium sp. 16-449-1b]|uniref:alpha/beta hydrolase n=1 Tax=Rhizobium sp. 16-449-1b TaxID=2819989 RepID=UPI001ADAAE2D|nr:alpha/beta hydrolase [Rhizobium sp. 16-449-1b]MBO9195932.1 alpha/beta hydrolase [Rhizobium sp. 16-449-1b]